MSITQATQRRQTDVPESHFDRGEDVDIIGVGFGPANLSLAIAIEEQNAGLAPSARIRARFIEQQPRFGWHDGMLLPGTTMQVSFLKDLVSLRKPTSPYTFLNYLHERGRLTDFINLKTFFPMRHEFHDYLSWAAERVEVPVSYGSKVTRVDLEDGRFVVTIRHSDGALEELAASTVVLGTGIHPVLPDGVTPGRRVFHNHRLLAELEQLPSTSHGRFLVVGAGQSAAEVVSYLHEKFPAAEVHASIRRFGFVPSDDTPYANRIFDPDAVDDYFTAPAELKAHLLKAHAVTNYAAVDAELIEELYRREYEEQLRGNRRLFVHRVTEVADLREDADGVTVTLSDLGGRSDATLEVDAVVFATGFRAADPRELFGDGLVHAEAFRDGEPIVARDYSLRLPGLEGRCFLNGGVEHSHGLSSSLLSNLAVRAAEILSATRLTQRLPGQEAQDLP